MILYNAGVRGEQSSLIELRDVFPTFLELAGVCGSENLDGLSLLRDNGREYLHGEHSGDETTGNQYIVTKTDKYCWFMQSGREQYFDLSKDPFERHDKIDDPACSKRIAYLRSLLMQELREREEGYTDGSRLIAGQSQRAVLHFLKEEMS